MVTLRERHATGHVGCHQLCQERDARNTYHSPVGLCLFCLFSRTILGLASMLWGKGVFYPQGYNDVFRGLILNWTAVYQRSVSSSQAACLRVVELDVMAHFWNPTNWGAEAEDLPWVLGQPGLHSEFQARLNYREGFCLNQTKPNNQSTNKKTTQNFH